MSRRPMTREGWAKLNYGDPNSIDLFPGARRLAEVKVTLPGKPQLGGRRHVSIDQVGGQITAPHGAERGSREIARGEVLLGGERFVLISFRGGDVEVYRVGLDNFTETFVGYARDAIKHIVGEQNNVQDQ